MEAQRPSTSMKGSIYFHLLPWELPSAPSFFGRSTYASFHGSRGSFHHDHPDLTRTWSHLAPCSHLVQKYNQPFAGATGSREHEARTVIARIVVDTEARGSQFGSAEVKGSS